MTAILNAKRTDALMAAGVTIVDPASTWIGPDVTVGADTILHPNVFLEGRTTVGSGCVIHACVRLVDTVVEDNVVINNFCVITESYLASGAQLGPFAHLRPQSRVESEAKVGNFVELKKTTLGPRIEGESPDVSRRRDDRVEGEHRRRDDHVQLRRYPQASDDHRRRGVHRQRFTAGRAGPHRSGRLRGGGIVHYGRRARRGAGNRARTTGEQAWVGRNQEALIG